jgi:predicted Zn-dependent protease
MMYILSTRSCLALVTVLLCVAVACSINPATGKREFVLYSEADEIRIGRESDASLVESLGMYPDDSLQEYVQALGDRLAANSERPQLPWTFRVVDDPVVNAFALPGGYIYITRGILAYLNTESELSGVVGHEIGHVTARHGVSQMSRTQLTNYGLAIGSVASEDVARWAGVAGQGLGLLFLKYSRDDEKQADELGLRYLLRAGYDPRPMADVYGTLEAVAESSGAGRIPSLLSTHPDPGNRRDRILSRIDELEVDTRGLPSYQARLFTAIDGIVFGDDPRQGYFEGSLFLHPELRFQIRFPEGWQSRNARATVTAVAPDETAVVMLTLAAEGNPQAALDTFVQGEGIVRGNPWIDQIQGIACASTNFTWTADGRTRRGRVAFVAYEDHLYRLVGMSSSEQWATHHQALASSIRSFDRLTDPAALSVQPHRVKVVRADRSMSLDQLAAVHDASVSIETLALINQLAPTSLVEAGRAYKVVIGGR